MVNGNFQGGMSDGMAWQIKVYEKIDPRHKFVSVL